MSSYVPRLNRRVLTVFLLVGLPILAVGVAIVLALGQARLRDSYGYHLGQVAQQTAAAVDTYVYRRLLDVSLLGRTPELRRAAELANARPVDRAAVDRIDRAWQESHAAPPEVADVLTNPAAQFLADLVAHDQIYRELLLTDRYGRLVASSNVVSDYNQADEDWWISTFEDGTRGRATMTDVRWDESARRFAIEIAVPVPAPGRDGLAGVLKVVADSREMLAIVGGVQLGATGEATLLRDNGTVVFSRRSLQPDARFFAADALAGRVVALREGGPQKALFFQARSDDDDQLVAIAPSQLASSYQNLSWIVAVNQSEAELLAPVRTLGWYLLMTLILTALAVVVLALWLSMRIAATPLSADMHLVEHPAVMHVGETDEPILGRR